MVAFVSVGIGKVLLYNSDFANVPIDCCLLRHQIAYVSSHKEMKGSDGQRHTLSLGSRKATRVTQAETTEAISGFHLLRPRTAP